MSSYPVPGEWFDNLSAATHEEDDYVYDELDVFDDEEYDPRPAVRYERVELDPLSSAVHQLRRLASQLTQERHPLAHVPQQIANQLIEVRAPAPRAVSGPAHAPGDFGPSPTGNCTRCGRALPMPTMRRGRPRTLCTTCSPPRT